MLKSLKRVSSLLNHDYLCKIIDNIEIGTINLFDFSIKAND